MDAVSFNLASRRVARAILVYHSRLSLSAGWLVVRRRRGEPGPTRAGNNRYRGRPDLGFSSYGAGDIPQFHGRAHAEIHPAEMDTRTRSGANSCTNGHPRV